MSQIDEPVPEGWDGRYFEDFVVGHRFRHPLGRTITAADNVWLTLLTMNTNPIHVDARYAAQTEFGRPLVNSCLTLALVTGLSVDDVSRHAFANLGWDEVRLPAPVFEGDTIYAESVVVEVRPSASRPTVGMVRVRTRGFNQDGTVVIEFLRSILVYRRGQGPQLPGLPGVSGEVPPAGA
jgi:itaconyl-CoA hydratase